MSGEDHDDVREFTVLFQQLGYTPGDHNWQAPEEWLEEDSADPGLQIKLTQTLTQRMMIMPKVWCLPHRPVMHSTYL